MKSVSIPLPIAWAGSGDTRLLKSGELQRAKTDPTPIRSNISAVFYLGAAKAAKNFLFATYTCFIRRNGLSPAGHWVCLSQGKNCHCSIFCRDTASSRREPARRAGTSSAQPRSSLQAHF